MSQVTFDPTKNVWTGPSSPYLFANKSVGEVLYETLLKDLDHISQISDDSAKIYTNKDMLEASISFSNALRENGLNEGDNVLFLTQKHHYVTPALVGCSFAGVVFCPIFYTDTSVKTDICELIQQIAPKMMIISYLDLVQEFQEIIKQSQVNCSIYVYENKFDNCLDLKPLFHDYLTPITEFCPAKVSDSERDLFAINLSSATTSKPKLINLTHKQMLLTSSVGATPSLKMCCLTEMGWISALFVIFRSLMLKHTHIFRAEFTIDEALNLMEKYKVQVVMAKPKDLFNMLKSDIISKVDLSSIRLVITAGEHLSVKVAKDFQKYIPNGHVSSIYGMTDMGGAITDASIDKFGVKNYVGKVTRNIEMVVIDDEGNYLEPNEFGEICVKSTVLPFSGYYRNEKMTKESLNFDGYFYTGDLGYIDEEGNIFVSDRKRFFISYGGKLLNQSEIEQIILDNVDGVSGVCVVDVENDKHGAIPYIAIIPEYKKTLSENEIIKTVMKYHEFEFETRIFFFDKLPMTISGKFKKYLVRDMILEKIKNE